MKPFDIFLSYRSIDTAIAERLRDALSARGARVWLDKDRIRPGDNFAEALETGLGTSRSVGLIVTPESLASNWVKNEYYRALSLSAAGELQLIPLLFGSSELPGFLKDRSWLDFQNNDFSQTVDKLIWPGITGKRVLFVSVHPGHGFSWRDLSDDLKELGCEVAEGEDITRARYKVPRYFEESPVRVVVVIDIFESWPRKDVRRNSPREYVQFILRLREQTRGTPNEIVFMLYHNSAAFDQADHGLSSEHRKRLAHYFTLHSDISREQRKEELNLLWSRIQRELLNTEHERA